MSMQSGLVQHIHNVLTNYPQDQIGEGITDHTVREIIESDFIDDLDRLLDSDDLTFDSSVGKGRWTAIPWVAILDSRLTETINDGVYVVYLFEPKENRVSLTLNQGVKRLRENEGMARAREILRSRAEEIRDILELSAFRYEELEFPDASSRTELYGPGTIAYKQYQLRDLPDEDTAISDLREIVDAYQQLIGSGDLTQILETDTERPSSIQNQTIIDEDDVIYQVPVNSGDGPMRRNFERTVVDGIPAEDLPDVFETDLDQDRAYVWGNSRDEDVSNFAILFGDRLEDEYPYLATVSATTRLSDREAADFAAAVGWEGDNTYSNVFLLEDRYELDLPTAELWDLLGYNGFPQDSFSKVRFDRRGSTFYDHHVSRDEFFREMIDRSQRSPNSPTVWIEKTRQEGRDYKQQGELALGRSLIAPSRDEGGMKRYESLREAKVGDIVLHLLQEDHQIVGISRIASDLREDFEGPPDDRWSAEQQQAGGYLRELAEYSELNDPVKIYDDILENEEYTEELRKIREETDEKIIYNNRLSLNQGHYFTKVPEDLLRIFVAESTDLSEKLSNFGVELPEPTDNLPDSVESYDTLTEAMKDIRHRLEHSSITNWIDAELSTTIIQDWTEVLTVVAPGVTVSPETEVRLKQIRNLYRNNESRLRDEAERLGSGGLNHISKPQTLFVAYLRDLQEQAGIDANINQVKIKITLNEEYDVQTTTGKDEDDVEDEHVISHPLLTHLDDLPASAPIRKFTAPPDYWLTALQYGTVSFEPGHEDVYDSVRTGDLVFLHSRSEPGDDRLDAQPNGIIGVGILGKKTRKDEHWWADETEEEPFDRVMNFDRLFVTSNLDEIDFKNPVTEQSQEALAAQLEALTAGILDYDEVQTICQETNGIEFPAQGAHMTFHDANGDADHERPRALLKELVGRLQETATINAHEDFAGTLPTNPLEGLHFPGNQNEEIVTQIQSALRGGKHIILTGPPGTGKTEIAERVLEYLADEYPYLYSDYQLTTATADWSTFDTVGGYMPEESSEDGDELSFTPGVILNRLKSRATGLQQNEPIVIDEINRADIDKAFGQLFTLLSGQSVQLPYTRNGEEIELLDSERVTHKPANHEYVVPESWRIIATMNTYDKTSLYEMSYAFMRRFAFIRISAPTVPEDDDDLEDFMIEYTQVWDIDLGRSELAEVGRVWRAMNTAVEGRAIGPAIVEDILRYVNQVHHDQFEEALTTAIISYLYPQLEGVPKRETIVRNVADVPRVNTGQLKEAAREMLQVNLRNDE